MLERFHAMRDALTASLRVPAACASGQQAIVRARLLALAPVLAALTLAWSVLDVVALQRNALPPVLGARILIAASLLALAGSGDRFAPMTLLRLFFALQAIGFGALQAFVLPDPAPGPASVGYGLAPFVLAAQVALFPVTWWQAVRLGLAPALALTVTFLAAGRAVDAVLWNDVWLLALLLGIGAWTSQTQLRLLVGLTSARDDASRDALTGLSNRRAAMRQMAIERDRSVRSGSPMAIAMLDLDRFKAVNDEWGHAAGDAVLRAVAAALAVELRACDIGARFGGEEFLVALPDTGPDDALRVAERMRRRIGALQIDLGDAVLAVTVSGGIAQLRPGELLESCIARADAALYRAKAAGRDRCIVEPEARCEHVAG